MEFLKSQGVPFVERDVVADEGAIDELLKHTGGVRGTPVIVIGSTVLRGFNRGKVSELLGLS